MLEAIGWVTSRKPFLYSLPYLGGFSAKYTLFLTVVTGKKKIQDVVLYMGPNTIRWLNYLAVETRKAMWPLNVQHQLSLSYHSVIYRSTKYHIFSKPCITTMHSHVYRIHIFDMISFANGLHHVKNIYIAFLMNLVNVYPCLFSFNHINRLLAAINSFISIKFS